MANSVIVRRDVLNWEADPNDHGTRAHWKARLTCGHLVHLHLGPGFPVSLPLELACPDCTKIAIAALDETT